MTSLTHKTVLDPTDPPYVSILANNSAEPNVPITVGIIERKMAIPGESKFVEFRLIKSRTRTLTLYYKYKSMKETKIIKRRNKRDPDSVITLNTECAGTIPFDSN